MSDTPWREGEFYAEVGLGLRPGDSFFVRYLGRHMEVGEILGGPGQSGMGIVYLLYAEDTTWPLVLKTSQQILEDESREAFREEAWIWVHLGAHPNVVRAWFVDSYDEQLYVSLEYAARSSLRSVLQAGLIPLEQTLLYASDFCRGMSHSRSRVPNLIHQDIKPENCLIKAMYYADGREDRYGVLAITDFGLARIEASPRGLASAPRESLKHGKRTALAGTLPYMAPEMFIAPDSIGASVDIYAFGVTLYEMLTGGRPFDAATPEEIATAHINQTPTDPRALVPAIPTELAALTLRCLAKEATGRPSGFDEIYESLVSHMEDSLRQREQVIASLGNTDDEAADLVHRAVSLDNMDDSHRALDLLDRALSLNSELATAWHSKGVVLARMRHYQGSLECTEHAIGLLQVDSAQTYLLALCLMIKGHTLSELGRDSEASVAYKSAARMHDDVRAQLRAAGVV